MVNLHFCQNSFMRIILGCLVGSVLFLSSCTKKGNGCSNQVDSTTAPASQQDTLKAYIDSAGISATLDPRGFYYRIVDEGEGASASPCSQVTVAYTGELSNGTVFDQQSSFVTILDRLVDGWQEGIPLIKKGGQIMLYIPPSLGYGETGNAVVPPNSILIFDISLTNVQ
jgi:FKBP-type peptidyl-prolyl cis-trans isomerase FkpA